jgi:hypothetical protein
VLLVISAGNHARLAFHGGAATLKSLNGTDRVAAVNAALSATVGARRLLSPAESINGVTVGALHADEAGDVTLGYRVDPSDGLAMFSPGAANGRGFRRALKPDVVANGGRIFYREAFGADTNELHIPNIPQVGPGIRVAMPPDAEGFAAGTSPAAALITRAAAEMHHVIAEVTAGQILSRRQQAVATKALLLHCARKPDGIQLPEPFEQFVGLGTICRDLADGCLPNEATVLFLGRSVRGRSKSFAFRCLMACRLGAPSVSLPPWPTSRRSTGVTASTERHLSSSLRQTEYLVLVRPWMRPQRMLNEERSNIWCGNRHERLRRAEARNCFSQSSVQNRPAGSTGNRSTMP